MKWDILDDTCNNYSLQNITVAYDHYLMSGQHQQQTINIQNMLENIYKRLNVHANF